ncbi:proline iminopeptidase-family hydrolase [Gaetbulibacter aestuarii]|uniref:Proline iminopeptidase-family hydrolase n=1 Tax=Gaetbulibacter aestuarii TaxID=1502358 RepID=A0ABW7N2H7_9FLAO
MKYFIALFSLCLISLSCKQQEQKTVSSDTESHYLDYSNRDDALSGGVKMIPIKTDKGTFNVWTKRVGNNPKMKMLLLHGGPGATHEYFESFDSYFPEAGIEYYYYDQLESAYSDQPNDSTLWTLDRYVDEVEQVRKALDLDSTNFYLLGHSWGGIVATEYALKYQKNLKGLVISNMVASVPEYNKYAQEVLGPQLPPEVLKEVKDLEANNEFDNPKYSELLFKYFYTQHILRMPLEDWPNPVNRAFEKLNNGLYVYMQGPSEFGITESAKLYTWDRSKDLPEINTPTLIIGAAHDTMDPKYMEWMSTQVQNGSFLLCPNGSHMAMYDDQKTYFDGLINFVKKVDIDASY